MESYVTQTQGYRISEAPQQSEVHGVEEMSWFKISQLTVDTLGMSLPREAQGCHR